MLEKMAEFFDNRISGYEEHQLTCIVSDRELTLIQGSYFDVPFGKEALFEAGFFKVKVMGQWGATFTLQAEKQNIGGNYVR